jgi:hypothetical protein
MTAERKISRYHETPIDLDETFWVLQQENQQLKRDLDVATHWLRRAGWALAALGCLFVALAAYLLVR